MLFFWSIAGFSAYVWLLQVRSATQVSTYAYVNPVVAVLLGVLFANENISILQIVGLVIILTSVLIINMAKQKKEEVSKTAQENVPAVLSTPKEVRIIESAAKDRV